MNELQLMGNLTRDPELRYTQSGSAWATAGIAINEKWTTQGGVKKEKVIFIDIKAFNKTAELLGQYYKKGKAILLSGKLDMESWDDKQTGQKRSKLTVSIEKLHFLPRTKGEQSDAPESQPAPPDAGRRIAAEDVPANEPENDDVPF